MAEPISIRDLGLIGDRRTVAAIDRRGSIVWFCPERFDRPSLFARLLDPDAGHWSVQAPALRAHSRRYLEDSAVLETTLECAGERWVLTDWMAADIEPTCLCRQLGPAPR